jgi:hypothetical protein
VSEHSGWFAFRHIFTSAPENFPGGGGFQTVACAAALREMSSLIEFLVESYKSLDRDGAHCRQFVPLPHGKAYALTVFTPLAESPDGRTGNFWAETQVVPIDWLEQAGWDAAAAFDALSWMGPRDLSRLPRNLEPEPLAPLEPGPVERLARLCELVPPGCLDALLHAVVQQSRGLRPLRLLEVQGAPASHLETVVTLLPLTVPPTSRRYRDDDQHRCLTLRTRCPVGGMAFPADITGYPAAAADNLELSDGFVVDLTGRLPATSIGDRFGLDYARWLARVIQEGRWDQLEALYRRASDFPGAAVFSNYRSLLEAPTRPRGTITTGVPKLPAAVPVRAERPSVVEPSEAAAAPSPAVAGDQTAPSPLQARKQAWAARDQTEGALWGVLESHKSQLEELVGKLHEDLTAAVKKASGRLRDEVEGTRRGLGESLKKIERDSASAGAVKADLNKLDSEIREVGNRIRHLEDRVSKLAEDFTSELKRADQLRDWLRAEIGVVQKRFGESLKKVERELVDVEHSGHQQHASAGAVKTDVDRLSREIAEIRKRISRLEKTGRPPEIVKAPPDVGVVKIPTMYPFRGPLALLRDWLRDNRWLIWGSGIGILLALLGVVALREMGNISPELFAPSHWLAEKARRDALYALVQPGKNAARLLESVARHEQVAPRAHLETLAIALSHGIPIDERLDCALLQATLQTEKLMVPVDGSCGNRTLDALVAAPKVECCRRFQSMNTPQDLTMLRSCFVTGYLQLGLEPLGGQVEACRGETPWHEKRSWTEEETARALALFQAASKSFRGEPDSELAQALRDLDPAQSPSLLQSLVGETLTRDEARRVLELAWAALSGHQGHLNDLSAGQFDDLDRFVDEIIQQGGGGAP